MDARQATYRDVFAVREFRALFASLGTLIIGDSVRMLALSVLVYADTGSPLLAALAYVSGFLPHALGGSFLLALADRWPPRTLMIGYDLLRLAVAVVLAVGVLPPLGMLALVFAAGAFAPVSMAARTALLPELLDGDGYVLARSLFTIAAETTQVAAACCSRSSAHTARCGWPRPPAWSRRRSSGWGWPIGRRGVRLDARRALRAARCARRGGSTAGCWPIGGFAGCCSPSGCPVCSWSVPRARRSRTRPRSGHPRRPASC